MTKNYVRSLLFFTLAASGLCAEQETPCEPGAKPIRIAVRHIESKGIGYNQGYTTLEFFAAPKSYQTIVPFVDLRGHVFNNGRWAANAGLGLRGYSDNAEAVFGGNLYYDYRKTGRKSYNQVGLGLEALNTTWEARANGYIPVGNRKTSPFQQQFDHFEGNRLFITQKVESALRGVDLEVGAHLIKKTNFDLYVGVGPYYYRTDCHHDAIGGKARIRAQLTDYLSLELSGSGDRIFHGIVQGEARLTYPFGGRRKVTRSEGSCFMGKLIQDRLIQPVTRQEIVVVNRCIKSALAINPNTNEPYNFIFVNNTGASLLPSDPSPLDALGTITNPWRTLAQAQLASILDDVIVVGSGDGTSTGYADGWYFQPNQYLWGATTQHILPLASNAGLQVPVIEPGLDPILTNASAMQPVIQLANGVQVQGFVLRAMGDGIVGDEVSDVSILNNTIENQTAGTDGIRITGGDFDIEYNIITALAPGNHGIYWTADVPGIYQTVLRHNTITNWDETIAMGIDSGVDAMTDIQFNILTPTTTGGIDLTSSGLSSFTYVVRHNAITGRGTASGARLILNDQSVQNGYFQDNRITSVFDGVFVQTATGTVFEWLSSNNLYSDYTNGWQLENEGLAHAEFWADYFSFGDIGIFDVSGGASTNGVVKAVDCHFVGNSIAGIEAQNSLGATSFLVLFGNDSDAPYELDNISGNFGLEPVVQNIGAIQTSGTITPVGRGTSN